jgi:hypothetical protein
MLAQGSDMRVKEVDGLEGSSGPASADDCRGILISDGTPDFPTVPPRK